MSDKVIENEFDRKEYNKNYYANNKAKILNYYKEKVICVNCGRSVCKQNIVAHSKRSICKNICELNKLIEKK